MGILYVVVSICIEVLLSWYLFKEVGQNVTIESRKVFELVFIVIAAIALCFFSLGSVLASFSNLLTFFIINFFISRMFEVERKKKLYILGSYFIFSMLSEAVSFYILDSLFFTNRTNDTFLLVGLFLSSTLKLVFVMYIMSRNMEQNKNNVPIGIFRWLLTVPILSSLLLVALLYLEYYYLNFSKIWVFLILVAIFLMNIAIFTLINSISEHYNKYIVSIKTLGLIEKKMQHYNGLESSFENIRIIKHDLKNSLTTTLALLENNQMEKAIKYLNELIEKTDKSEMFFYTWNEILNYILNEKISYAKKNAISITHNILIPETVNLGNDILSVIIGNLLDNSINACIEMDNGLKKSIDISIKVYKKNLALKIGNSYDPSIKILKRTKSNGLGLKSVKKLVDEKNGIYSVKKSDNYYSTSIILFDVMN